MPDISMCNQDHCPRRLKCYRYMAVPNPYRQSYATFDLEEDCIYWMKIMKDDDVRTPIRG